MILSPRWSRYLAAVVPLALSTALLIAGLVLASKARGFELFGPTNTLVTSVSFFVFPLVGSLIIVRGSTVVGWVFAAGGLAWAALSFGDAAVVYTRIHQTGSLPAEDLIVWASSWVEFFGIGATPALLLLVFPDGRLASRRSRYLLAFIVFAMSLGVIGSAFAPGPFEDWPSVSNPYGVGGVAGEAFAVMLEMGWALLSVSLILAIRGFAGRFRHAGMVERQQMKWMVLAGMLVLLFLAFWAASSVLFGEDAAAEASQGVALVPIPLAAGIAIVRYGLYDIDVIINRAAIYALLSAILGSAYFGLVVVFQRLFDPFTSDSDLVIAASTLIVAGLFRPVRARVQAFIDHRFYRSRYDAAETLGAFSARLRDQVDLDTLNRELLAVVGTTMQPQHASLWVRTREGERG